MSDSEIPNGWKIKDYYQVTNPEKYFSFTVTKGALTEENTGKKYCNIDIIAVSTSITATNSDGSAAAWTYYYTGSISGPGV
ncbi:MAG: hypothetical protein PUJ51_15360 [Clostridiales bacterium]|nr:hypothetical protein [Clostridiales bacterium]